MIVNLWRPGAFPARGLFHARFQKERFRDHAAITQRSRCVRQVGLADPVGILGMLHENGPQNAVHEELEKAMKRQIAFFAALAVLALAGPLSAETAPGGAENCLAAQPTTDISDACLALRTEFRAKVSDCMTRDQVTGESILRTAGSMTNHAFRARYLLCGRDVRDVLGLARN